MSRATRLDDGAQGSVCCSLPEDAQGSRRRELAAGLAKRIRDHRELPDGYALAFDRSAEAAAEIRAFIEFEQGCCGFLDFRVRDDEDANRRWLELTGPDGSKEFLRGWIAAVQASR